jgi:predicted nucleic acid-binding protein
MKIYFDVCCLNRPFDDHTQDRVRLESEAVLTILDSCGIKGNIFLSSEVIDIEISKIPDDDRKQKVIFLFTISQSFIIVDIDIEKRAMELEKLNFSSFDSLHIACAERGNADILLTTDDNLLRKALQNKNILKGRVENPVKWLMEEIEK